MMKQHRFEEVSKTFFLQRIKMQMRICIDLEKRYQKLRSSLSEVERKRLDSFSGWFEYQDN